MSDSNSLHTAGFFLRLAGGALLAGIAFFIIAAIFLKLIYALGILGFFVFLVVVGLIAGWRSDREAERRRAAELGE